MKIELRKVKVRDITNGYLNNDEEGVFGYRGSLNIRPKYQREFIYKDKKREDVIHTVRKDFPLNVMYWVKNADSTYEVLDGQQRTISICEYVDNKYSINHQKFFNLEKEEQEQILDYEVMVYFCEGETREKLDWFKTINIAGEKLTAQELRNAIYSGPWLEDAKRYFSRTACAAYAISKDYVKGVPLRQEYLETAIKWINLGGKIEECMSQHQHDKNALELWEHYQKVVDWVKAIYPNYRKEMKGVDWGTLYSKYCDQTIDLKELEQEIKTLMQDEDVTKKAGIYTYVLSRDEKYLSIRAFTDRQKREAFERQDGVCVKCNETFGLKEMEADHITPWSKGGKTNHENCQMLCMKCNRTKSDK